MESASIAEYAIIVAGGKGLRMGTDIPKQFALLAGRPVLMRTVESFIAYNPSINVIIVLPQSNISFWEELCRQYGFRPKHLIAIGGAERYHSVKNGLALVSGLAMVAIHDGVRPLASSSLIRSCFADARTYGSSVPCVQPVDSVRQIVENGNRQVPRECLRLVQTPQVFSIELLVRAYSLPYEPGFTDDASLVEKLGHKLRITEGQRSNIKITNKEDLDIAEILYEKMRTDT
jgi:2-C-methyl-D-erythritol 4-phosphate cytidylyltransferase